MILSAIARTHGKELQRERKRCLMRFLNSWWLKKGFRPSPLPFEADPYEPWRPLYNPTKSQKERALIPKGTSCPCNNRCGNPVCQDEQRKEYLDNKKKYDLSITGPSKRSKGIGGVSKLFCPHIQNNTGHPEHPPFRHCFIHLNLPKTDDECLEQLRLLGSRCYDHAKLIFYGESKIII